MSLWMADLTLFVPFVSVAFTVLLIPVAVLGLLGELIALYGQVVLGLATRLPEREDIVIVVGFGAVLNAYFGLARFEPVNIPGGAAK